LIKTPIARGDDRMHEHMSANAPMSPDILLSK
jgi:hypothetical protein